MSKSHPLAATLPMEAKLVGALPRGPGWQYMPKWNGFRAIASRSGCTIEIMSKSGKSLARYFPEIVTVLAAKYERDFVLDGELIFFIGEILSFDALQSRLHPAASRIARLSVETSAKRMLFDCLAVGGRDLVDALLEKRRAAIERFHAAEVNSTSLLAPATTDERLASVTPSLKRGS